MVAFKKNLKENRNHGTKFCGNMITSRNEKKKTILEKVISEPSFRRALQKCGAFSMKREIYEEPKVCKW